MSPAAGVAVSPEVATAHTNGGAVIALETTIVCHGMPYPKNLQTAMEVEAIVRETAPSIVQEAGSRPYMPSLSTTSRNPSAKCYGDRFIPDRSAMDMNMSHYLLTETKKDKENAWPWRHPLRCSI